MRVSAPLCEGRSKHLCEEAISDGCLESNYQIACRLWPNLAFIDYNNSALNCSVPVGGMLQQEAADVRREELLPTLGTDQERSWSSGSHTLTADPDAGLSAQRWRQLCMSMRSCQCIWDCHCQGEMVAGFGEISNGLASALEIPIQNMHEGVPQKWQTNEGFDSRNLTYPRSFPLPNYAGFCTSWNVDALPNSIPFLNPRKAWTGGQSTGKELQTNIIK